MCQNARMQNRKSLLKKQLSAWNFLIQILVILIHHEFDKLDNNLPFTGVHDDIHDNRCKLLIGLWLICVHLQHVIGVELNDFGQQDAWVIAYRLRIFL